VGFTWLPNMSTYSLAIFGHEEYWDQQNTVARYCCPNNHRTSPVFHFWNQTFHTVGFLRCSPNVNSSWCREQREGRFIWPYHARVSSCLMFRFHGRDTIWALLSVIRGLAIAALPWMLDLWKLT
jgi:hypothetical protein